MSRMPALASEPKAYRQYDLVRVREDSRPRRQPATHQIEALGKLQRWFGTPSHDSRGGILVLPTGGGKTFTAVRFLCTEPLSAGYKVLWLAHTHHLLEQAADAFGTSLSASLPEAASIAEPKATLAIRLVSGTIGHCRVHEIRPDDDVVVCTLPTAARALAEEHPDLMRFLDAAGDRLIVVFDEAHHSPAPTYTRLLLRLRERHPRLVLLGLTATPTYTDEGRRGWLRKIFPQEIIHRAQVSTLMANRILARPRFEQVRTRFTPAFSAREYAKWAATFQDLPEHIVTELAEDRSRNDCIVGTYLENRERYGRTLVFADRWYQCDYLREALRKHGVRADVVYSHVAIDRGGAEARNRRTADDNAKVLEAFRRGDLDVLINVRMLTEGTDVSHVQTVFLTRQTTSQILLTQMVGRALRGPAFGGTENAFIVSFVDEWTQPIAWAPPEDLNGGTDGADRGRTERPPVQLISIELVRRLARALHDPTGMTSAESQSALPLGWYRTEFDAQPDGTDEVEQVRELVLVYDTERDAYQAVVDLLASPTFPAALRDVFARPDVRIDAVVDHLDDWSSGSFPPLGQGEDAAMEEARLDARRLAFFRLARHVAQNGGRPIFFPFEERAQHDMDALARHFLDAGLDPQRLRQSLRAEYESSARFWKVLYPRFELFMLHHHWATQQVLEDRERGGAPPKKRPGIVVIDSVPREVDDATKRAVLARDGYRCLCCGCDSRRRLEIDHVAPSYFGGTNHMDNLQVLCGVCNRHKGISELNFRQHVTPLAHPPAYARIALPPRLDERDLDAWKQHIRRTLNFFYRCAAVQDVLIAARGPAARHWQAVLYPGNDDRWLNSGLLAELRQQVAEAREACGLVGPDRLTVQGTRQRRTSRV